MYVQTHATDSEHSLGELRRSVLGQALVELGVLLVVDFVRFARPDGFVVIHEFPVPNGFFGLFGFAFLFGGIFDLERNTQLFIS